MALLAIISGRSAEKHRTHQPWAKWKLLAAFLVFAAIVPTANCRELSAKHFQNDPRPAAPVQRRDWNLYPAVVERDTSAEVMALGDVHGGDKRLVKLLAAGGLIAPDSHSPAGYSWAGGNRTLVCTGDLIDKGAHSLEVLDLMMALESQARAAGGEVIVTLGNHEAEFFADPQNDKAKEFRAELKAKGIDPAALPKGQRPYGEWMMRRPFAARVNDWFFAHGGNTAGKTISELSEEFRQAVDKGTWNSSTLIGDDSLLEARNWWKGDGRKKGPLDNYLRALRVRHIVFGHDPSAFHAKGQIGQESDGRLFLIDVGMSPAVDYSHGALLLVRREGHKTVAKSLDAEGKSKEIWRE